ncbi:MAG: Rrf2 family transcriptional regulator [Rhodopila sp.]
MTDRDCAARLGPSGARSSLKDPESATIGEVAGRLQVSGNHLMKVVHRLGVGGYVQTLRGKSGGLRLARPASEIRLGDVVRYTESDMALVPCLSPVCGACAFLPECALRKALEAALKAFTQVLDGYSIADLTTKRGPLRALLAMQDDHIAVPTQNDRRNFRRRQFRCVSDS